MYPKETGLVGMCCYGCLAGLCSTLLEGCVVDVRCSPLG